MNPRPGGSASAYTPDQIAASIGVGRTKAQEFLAEHHMLEREVEHLKRENNELRVHRDVCVNSLAETREELERTKAMLKRAVGYNIRIRERFVVLGEQVEAIHSEAAAFAAEEQKIVQETPAPSSERMTEEEVDAALKGMAGSHNTKPPENKF
jgi:chromosome segregation ATPase